MAEAFRLGGWGMWPTLLFGLLMIASALYYALRADQKLSSLVRLTGWMTFISGCLGFVTGLIRASLFVGKLPPDERYLLIIGFGESLYNIAWALVLIMLALIVSAIGSLRVARQDAP